ncbi:MAG TPA: type IV pilin protein [Steroidobacteraceae bacterium]|nr:type IV pilin protein [Steroidobacteraceae bacterium]
MTKTRGFTLIELMVVLVVVAILAAVAFPAYRESVKRGHRRAAQSVMMDIVNRQHQYFVANRGYASVAELNYTLPPDVGANYTYDIVLDPGPPPGFQVVFTPTGGQVSDGNLSVDSNGTKTPAEKW